MNSHRLLRSLIGVLLILGGSLTAPAASFRVTEVRSGDALAIDGRFDEAVWQRAPLSDPLTWLGVKSKPGTPAKTQFRVLSDAHNVYFGIICQEPQMAKLRDSRVGPVSDHDCVEIFLAPDGRPNSYYQFMIGAGNDLALFHFIEGGNTTDGEFNTPIETAVFKGPDYWTVEARIPLSGLFRTPSSAFSDVWLVNVARERQEDREYTTWSPLRASFHEPAKFRSIGGMPRKAPRFDLTPTGIRASIVGARDGEGSNPVSWTGTLTIPTQATAVAAGSCLLSVRADGHDILTQRPVRVAAGAGEVVVENVSFPRLGKGSYEVVFTSQMNQVIADAIYTLRVDYEPIVITLVEPFYGEAIFPGQQVRNVRGHVTLNLSADMLAKTQLRLAMAGKSLLTPLRGNVADFAFDATNLEVGDHTLTAEAICDGKVLAETKLVIRKLAQPAGSGVYIDEHLRLVVDGKPVFARGWYSTERYLVSQALRNQYGSRPDSEFVNAWHCELRLEAERLDPTERSSGRVKKDVEPSAKVIEAMTKLITANHANKDVWWYYLCDEPECRGVSPVYLKHQYDLIKKLDPYRPVMIVTRDPARYTQCADILNPHPYLAPTVSAKGERTMKSPKEIRNQVRTVLSAGGGRIPAWLTPQAFSYGFQDPWADNPTFREYRCMLWTAVANGATGFTPFIYCGHFATPDLRIGHNFIYESLARVEPILLSDIQPKAVKVMAPEDGVDVWCKMADGKMLLIAVNLLNENISADIEIADLADVSELVGFRETTTAKLVKGKLRLNFSPYQVHLLSNVQLDEGLRSVEAVQRDISEANAALKKPGNILYGRGREIEWTSSDNYAAIIAKSTLTDGMCDTLGWSNWGKRKLPAWLEMQFPTFTPQFRSAKIYSATIEDMDFLVWKSGDWKKVAGVRGNTSDVMELRFSETIRTIKVKLLISKVRSGPLAEVYEIELYQ